MIPVTAQLSLNEEELEWEFTRASGPGGRNVNKVSSAVQLRFDVRHNTSLPQEVKERLIRLASKRITQAGGAGRRCTALSQLGSQPSGCRRAAHCADP
ncbi:MAG: hypothetical protein NZ765_07250 [Anaerolineae bacterium]|nr:hypothetical protein [Anaerolineae bacterium]MDW8071339.1 peptide chain release factor-like protein [Anaerolineae bacterium]